MKLLLISVKSDAPTGGIAVWTEHFLARCKQYGIQCDLVNTQISAKRIKNGKRHIWDEYLRTKRIFHQLKQCLSTNTYDAVYLNSSCGPFGLFRDKKIVDIVAKQCIPLATHYHCEIPFWVKKKRSIRCLGRLAQLSDANLVLCESSKVFLEKHYHIASVKVPNFVESSIIRTDNKEIRPTLEQIFFVGKVTESKGAKELFDVARQLPDISFKFAGNVSQVVKHWDKPANITLLGGVPHAEVLRHLDESDLFLFPSHTEGSSIALIECMARGVPAVATSVGSNADMLKDGCGILVEKEDIDAMLAAIHTLRDPLKREAMSRSAVQRATEQYSDKNIDCIVNELKKLVETKKEILK